MEYSKKLRKKFKSINIIYKPVKSPEEKKFSVTTLKIYQSHTEILVETAKNYGMGLPLIIIVESFLQELTNKKDTLKIVLVFQE